MNFLRKTLSGNHYIGVSTLVTEEIALMPLGTRKKDFSDYEKCFQVEVFKSSIAGSSAIGVLGAGLGRKVLVPSQAEEREVRFLESKNIEVERIDCVKNAVGNLIALNSNAAIISGLLGEEEEKRVKSFFKVKTVRQDIAGSPLVGSAVRVTEKGFIAHPAITEKEYESLKKLFKVKGEATTANYGDGFVAKSVVANSKGVAFGSRTSGPELARIDDALS